MAALARDHAFSRAAGASLARPAGCLLAHLRQRCTLVPPVGPEGVPIRATRAPFVSRAKRPWEVPGSQGSDICRRRMNSLRRRIVVAEPLIPPGSA